MKISDSKKELAKIISENGGWRDEAGWSSQDRNGSVTFFVDKPWLCGDVWEPDSFECVRGFGYSHKLPNWHQTILSRAEYFHLYPAPDAEAEQKAEIRWVRGKDIYATPTAHDCMEMLKEKWGFTECGCDECSAFYSKHAAPAESTIEQLAADYRNRKDYADRKQQEADAAKADAEDKLAELVSAGKVLGLVLGVAEPEPELVITDWRDLHAGDVISVSGKWWKPDSEFTVDENDGSRNAPIKVGGYWAKIGECSFKFIRRP